MRSNAPAGPPATRMLEGINRAARLADGQQVMVPERGPGGLAATTAGAAEDGPISLGSATVEQLETIDGIGPSTAGRSSNTATNTAASPRSTSSTR